jgi:hypothetical protein
MFLSNITLLGQLQILQVRATHECRHINISIWASEVALNLARKQPEGEMLNGLKPHVERRGQVFALWRCSVEIQAIRITFLDFSWSSSILTLECRNNILNYTATVFFLIILQFVVHYVPKKSKAIFVTGRGELQGCEMLRIPHCLDNRLTDCGKVVSPTHRLRSTPQKRYFSASGTHFC